jgi:hypothetical protein
MSMAGFGQRPLNAGAAVGLAAVRVDLKDVLGQAHIFLGARTGLDLAAAPVVIPAGGYFQGGAERANGVLDFHRVNPLKPLFWGSERMPKVFFKISRCWRR